MLFVHDTEMPASTTALSWPSAGPRKVADGPEISANPAVIGSVEYLNSCSQVALRNGSTTTDPTRHWKKALKPISLRSDSSESEWIESGATEPFSLKPSTSTLVYCSEAI